MYLRKQVDENWYHGEMNGQHGFFPATYVKVSCGFLALCIQENLCKTATLIKTENWFSRPIALNAGQKYCRMLQGEHSAILSAFIKLPFVIKIFVLSIFESLFYTGFTVLGKLIYFQECMSITGL